MFVGNSFHFKLSNVLCFSWYHEAACLQYKHLFPCLFKTISEIMWLTRINRYRHVLFTWIEYNMTQTILDRCGTKVPSHNTLLYAYLFAPRHFPVILLLSLLFVISWINIIYSVLGCCVCVCVCSILVYWNQITFLFVVLCLESRRKRGV